MSRVAKRAASAGVTAAALFIHVLAGAQESAAPESGEATNSTAPPEPGPPPEEKESAPGGAPASPALSTLVFTRVGFRLQDPTAPKRLEHLSVDEINISPTLSGRVLPSVGWTFSLFGQGQMQRGAVVPSGGSVTVLDLVAQIEPIDAFNLWLGTMVIPSDRSNFSGTYFMSAWNYPGLYSAGGAPLFVGPKGDFLGRGVGATAWGQFGGGLLKYYVGAYQLDQPTGYPLYSGRLNLALINPEPGYFSPSTYYGAKDILAIGVGGQFQRDGSNQIVVDPATGAVTAGASRDFRELNADLLAEFNVGGGTITGELAVYLFDGYESAAPVDLAYFGLVKYLIPGEIGGGRLEPLFRYQATHDPDMHIIDVGLGYILAGPMLRFHVNFQRTDMGTSPAGASVAGNAVQLGAQLLYL